MNIVNPMNSSLSNNQLGRLGETAVAIELMKRGYEVINLNESLQNFKHADLMCVFSAKGKFLPIQVKTGSTKKIHCGLTGTPDGDVIGLDEKVVCPWVFVYVTKKPNGDFNFDFYILTRDEIKELLRSSHHWYALETKTGRKLKCNTVISVDVLWLEAKGTEETKLLKEYKSSLTESALSRWDKIDKELL